MSVNPRDPRDYVLQLLIPLMKEDETAFEMLFLNKNKKRKTKYAIHVSH
jgi:hypothetical protein